MPLKATEGPAVFFNRGGETPNLQRQSRNLRQRKKLQKNYQVKIGDSNVKVGPIRTPEELHIGAHDLQWNEQEERLYEFIMTTKTIHGYLQFQKPSSLRFTLESPDGGYRSEIDYIIVNKRLSLTDVAVVPKLYTGSDYRLLRGRFSFTRREEKAAKFRERNPRNIINWDLFTTLAGLWAEG
ncbi:hypothetical protein NECAME_03772 [Necator americanus]|uniref:Uncharacterized protein n=1 Tax=Necator americanus TaxID=51031 RepID=W2T060_NECAM|nr:hypothetical protein NECAME_03772 [Necator americanus]ETN75390.1 hypothetical protein NECAME_03772 [Necator americanus]